VPLRRSQQDAEQNSSCSLVENRGTGGVYDDPGRLAVLPNDTRRRRLFHTYRL